MNQDPKSSAHRVSPDKNGADKNSGCVGWYLMFVAALSMLSALLVFILYSSVNGIRTDDSEPSNGLVESLLSNVTIFVTTVFGLGTIAAIFSVYLLAKSKIRIF